MGLLPKAFPSESRHKAARRDGCEGRPTIEVEVDIIAGGEQGTLDADARKGPLAAGVAVADCRAAHAHLSLDNSIRRSCNAMSGAYSVWLRCRAVQPSSREEDSNLHMRVESVHSQTPPGTAQDAHRL